MTLKQTGKNFLARQLEAQIEELRQNNDFKVIAVVGSVGKTTTKLSIAKLLEPSLRVQCQSGNYNDRITVPLVFFGHTQPGIFNVKAWLKLIRQNRKLLTKPFPYDVVVVELGSDGPGQIKDFAYIKPDISIITALTDEHMEYFKTLDAVAKEELTVAQFSETSIINIDDSPAKYLLGLDAMSYGLQAADYQITNRQPQTNGGQILSMVTPQGELKLTTSLIGKPGAKSVLAAVACGQLMGLNTDQINAGVQKITAVPGRMQLLKGIRGSAIIDDTYNASPVAVMAALDALYAMPAGQRIALLGNMNEMGALSPNMHKDIGKYCDHTKLDLVVTLGPDANKYLAPAAAKQGCKVKSFDSPYKAGAYLQRKLKDNAVVLVKGSQNRVYAEEAIKSLLQDPADAAKLVRQSAHWLNIKREQFNN